MHFEDIEKHECTVNASEFAAHVGATTFDSIPNYTSVRTPSVTTLFGETREDVTLFFLLLRSPITLFVAAKCI